MPHESFLPKFHVLEVKLVSVITGPLPLTTTPTTIRYTTRQVNWVKHSSMCNYIHVFHKGNEIHFRLTHDTQALIKHQTLLYPGKAKAVMSETNSLMRTAVSTVLPVVDITTHVWQRTVNISHEVFVSLSICC